MDVGRLPISAWNLSKVDTEDSAQLTGDNWPSPALLSSLQRKGFRGQLKRFIMPLS